MANNKLLTFLFILLTVFYSPLHAQQTPALFSVTGERQTEWAGKSPADIQAVSIEFSEQKIARLQNQDATDFSFRSPAGNEFEVEVNRVIDFGDGNWSITGHINGNWENAFTMSFSDGRAISGMNVITNHQFYQLRYDEQQEGHMMVKIDPHQIDALSCGVHEEHEVDHAHFEKPWDNPGDPEHQTEGPIVIDVMVLYTPAAWDWANLPANQGINNIVNQAMALAQQTADAGQTNIEFNLIHRGVVDYNESGNAYTDLRRLTASTAYNPFGSAYAGHLEEVHEMRNEYGADLVAMFTLEDNVGGLAWLLRDPAGRPETGFSITRIQQAYQTPTLVHEMGHNMGLAHSRNQEVNPAGADGGLYTYSTGWRWIGDGGQEYVSAMTYLEGAQGILTFSNPDVISRGAPTGSYTGPYSPADNARSLREVKHVISNYRLSFDGEIGPPSVTTAPITAIQFSSARTGGNVESSGGGFVSDRGVCWSEFPDPDITDECLSAGTGTGVFIITMANLRENTEYFVRAYAASAEGTSYGNERSFRTLHVEPPVVKTGAISSVTVSSAVVTGNVPDQGGSEVDDRGVCYSQLENPDINDICVSATEAGTGPFDITLTGLEHSTLYFVRAFATNKPVTVYGEQASFTTQTLLPPTVLAATDVNATFFTVNWGHASQANRYRIDFSRDPGFSEFLAGYENRNLVDGTSHTITGLAPNTAYYYRIRSVIDSGQSRHSPVAETRTLDISAGNSTLSKSNDRVLATGVQESEVTITVLNSHEEPVEGVRVLMEPDGGSSEITVLNDITDVNGEAFFAITNNTKETIHYTVIAAGLELSQKFRVEFLFSDGELVLGHNFPNPFSNQTMIPIALPQQMHVRIDLYNSGGAHIQTLVNESFNTGYYEIPFTPAGLSSGVYFYRMVTDNDIKTEKLLLIQ